MASLITVLLGLVACDPDGKKQCEWYLMPEPQNAEKVTKDGYIPVCARNLSKNKEDCRLQAKLEFAKSVFNKKFRYVDMQLKKNDGFPQTVESLAFCR